MSVNISTRQSVPLTLHVCAELLWTAPEILRGPTPGLTGSKQGDVYSFSIILQEVLMRGPPFCMLDQSAQGLSHLGASLACVRSEVPKHTSVCLDTAANT